MPPRKPPKPPQRPARKSSNTGRTDRPDRSDKRSDRRTDSRSEGRSSSHSSYRGRSSDTADSRQGQRGGATAGRPARRHEPDKQYTPRPMQGLCYGRNPALLMLQHAPERVVSVTLQSSLRNKPDIQTVFEQATALKKPVLWESLEALDVQTENGVHQGVVLQAKPKPVWDLVTLEAYIDENPNVLLLALDQVQDPRNLGAIIRVAVAAGVDAIIYPKHGSASLTPLVEKASAGLTCVANLVEVPNLADAVERLKKRKIWWAGAGVSEDADSVTRPQDYHTIDYKGPFGLVMGSEGSGIRPRVFNACDYHITIPMSEIVESLNVSVATGIILFEAYRQRVIKPV